MIDVIFKKEENTLCIKKIYGEYPCYLCDIEYISGGKMGLLKSQPLGKLCVKLVTEKFTINSDVDKYNVWFDVWNIVNIEQSLV